MQISHRANLGKQAVVFAAQATIICSSEYERSLVYYQDRIVRLGEICSECDLLVWYIPISWIREAIRQYQYCVRKSIWIMIQNIGLEPITKDILFLLALITILRCHRGADVPGNRIRQGCTKLSCIETYHLYCTVGPPYGCRPNFSSISSLNSSNE